jgi:hypothetical protein
MKSSTAYGLLLNREDFKKFGFALTEGKCCIPDCKEDAVDAHHIMDRKLWKDGGYYLSNCAPLCAKHHIDAENGVYTPYEISRFAKIPAGMIKKPDGIDWLTDEEYKELFAAGKIDKWGK